jgi:hypothetical protein
LIGRWVREPWGAASGRLGSRLRASCITFNALAHVLLLVALNLRRPDYIPTDRGPTGVPAFAVKKLSPRDAGWIIRLKCAFASAAPSWFAKDFARCVRVDWLFSRDLDFIA